MALLAALVAASTVIGCFAQTIPSKVVHVSAVTGHDAPGCGATAATACASLGASLLSCPASSLSTCTLLLATGTYSGPSNCAQTLAQSGNVTIAGVDATLTQVQCSSGSWLRVTANNLTVASLTVTGCTTSALVIGSGSHVLLANCVFSNNLGTGIRLCLRFLATNHSASF